MLADFAQVRPGSLEVHGGTLQDKIGSALVADTPVPADGPEASRFREKVSALARRTPSERWQELAMKAKDYLADFSRPASVGDIGQHLVSEVLNTGGAIAIEPGPDSSVLRDLAAAYGKPGEFAERARELLDVDIMRFAEGVAGAGEPTALTEIHKGVPRFDPEINRWAHSVDFACVTWST